MENVKSVAPTQIPGKGWDVKVTFNDGSPVMWLCDKRGPYTLAQAQAAAASLKIKNISGH